MKKLIVVIVLVGLVSYPVAYKSSETVISITVKGKDRITTGSGEDISSKYIISSDKEVFENTDSWTYFKFNSTDLQNKIEEGKTYKVKVVGWRVPFLSMYRNIISKK